MRKYLHVFLSIYVEIDQVVFDKNTYAILTNRFTDGLSPGQPTTVSVRVARLGELCDAVCHALHGGVAGLGPSGGPPRDSD